MDSQVFEGGVLVQAPFVSWPRRGAGRVRLGRSPSHQGAFGRFSIILGVLSSTGKLDPMPALARLTCMRELPECSVLTSIPMCTSSPGTSVLVHVVRSPRRVAACKRSRPLGSRGARATTQPARRSFGITVRPLFACLRT